MSLQSELVELDDAACAKTNIIDIQGDIKDNIKRLLASNIGELFITYRSRAFAKEKGENTADFEKRIHREVKLSIRTDLSLAKDSQPEYELVYFWSNGQKLVYFFYLSATKTSFDELLRDINNNFSGKHGKIFEALAGLHLKLAFINQVVEEYELRPTYFNSELYLAAKLHRQPTSKGAAKLDALSPQLYFSTESELVTNIHRKSFQTQLCDSDDVRVEIDETQLLFRDRKSTYRASNKLSATQHSKKPFITFEEGYSQSINHAQNLVSDMLKSILKDSGVSFTERYFKADYALDNFIKVEKIRYRPLIIIDNLDKSISNDQRQQLYKQLSKELNPKEITTHEKLPHFDNLSADSCYLVLNSSQIKNGSSVIIDGKVKNTFWDALAHSEKYGTEDLDYYSTLKIARFKSNAPITLQGLNIGKLTQNRTDRSTSEVTTVFKPASVHKINKIKTELWLKGKVFFDKYIEEIDLPDCQLTLVYIRMPGGRWSQKMHSSIVRLRVLNGTLTINSQQNHASEQRLRFDCPFLEKRDLYNDSFYMFDEEDEVLLTAYNTDRIPRIIGNQQVDSLEVAAKNNDRVGRGAKIKETILPYYLLLKERKQYHHIFLQQRENDLLYFVSKINGPKQTIEKQNLIYNILTFDLDGNILNALDQTVTEIYLKSFTDNILKLGEVSKSSLLEKMAKIHIEN